MAQDKKQSMQQGLEAAEANAANSEEQQQVEELSSKLQNQMGASAQANTAAEDTQEG